MVSVGDSRWILLESLDVWSVVSLHLYPTTLLSNIPWIGPNMYQLCKHKSAWIIAFFGAVCHGLLCHHQELNTLAGSPNSMEGCHCTRNHRHVKREGISYAFWTYIILILTIPHLDMYTYMHICIAIKSLCLMNEFEPHMWTTYTHVHAPIHYIYIYTHGNPPNKTTF